MLELRVGPGWEPANSLPKEIEKIEFESKTRSVAAARAHLGAARRQ